jgi:quercetin dioxygenase-like cupin family protein
MFTRQSETEKKSNTRESLERLKILTDNLPAFPETVEDAPGFKEYETVTGTSLGWDLLNIPEISAAKWFNSKDTIFPEHHHPQKEWLVVYKGEMILEFNGKVTRLKPGEFAFIPPDTVHSATFSSDCWYLAITIPESEDWPR